MEGKPIFECLKRKPVCLAVRYTRTRILVREWMRNLLRRFTVNNATTIRSSFRRLNHLAGELLRRAPSAVDVVGTLIQELASVEQLLEDTLNGRNSRTGRGEGRVTMKSYSVEQTGEAQSLLEHRAEDDRPFRCPRPTFDAVAKTLAEHPAFSKYSSITDKVARRLGVRPADYQLRVAIRFLMSPDVRLVERRRARYRPVDGDDFLARANAAWSRLSPAHTQ
jgi:hypothetical protein